MHAYRRARVLLFGCLVAFQVSCLYTHACVRRRRQRVMVVSLSVCYISLRLPLAHTDMRSVSLSSIAPWHEEGCTSVSLDGNKVLVCHDLILRRSLVVTVQISGGDYQTPISNTHANMCDEQNHNSFQHIKWASLLLSHACQPACLPVGSCFMDNRAFWLRKLTREYIFFSFFLAHFCPCISGMAR